ncbi:MAG: LPS export ABC transporter periplasmic protein LptC [Mangrovibacterium sp.]
MNHRKCVQDNNLYHRQNHSLISIAVFLLGTAMLLFSCENKIERIKELSVSDKLPGMEAENFFMVHSDSSRLEFSLKTPLMRQYNQEEDKDPYTEFPKGVEIIRFGENRKIDSQITSDYALFYEKEGKWIAKNNVLVINQDGDSLKTEELVWERKSGEIYSDKFVKIIRRDQIITGIGFESDQNMANWKIKKVRGTLYLEVTE